MSCLAIDMEVELSVMRVWNGGFGNLIGDGAERVEALCYTPGKAFLFRFVLDIAGRHVDR